MFGLRSYIIMYFGGDVAAEIESWKQAIQMPPHFSLDDLLPYKIEVSFRARLQSLFPFIEFFQESKEIVIAIL